GISNSKLSIKSYLITFAFYFAFSFIRNNNLRAFVASFIIFMAYFQLAHLSFYGTQILPVEIWLLFTEMSEVFGTLRIDFAHILIPIFFTIPPIFLLFYFSKRMSIVTIPYIQIIFFFYLLFNPLRTYITGNNWGHRPSQEELYGVNTYLSFSYFLGKILPSKLSHSSLNSDETYQGDI